MTTNASPAFGLTLLVDKPLTWTSFDVVNKLRHAAKRTIGRKKIKVGHAGTLDPLATGLMIVCVGAHTKTITALLGMDKAYEGTMRLGATTPSYDLETEIDHRFAIPEKDSAQLSETAQKFVGVQEQMPPIFSAKKVDGKKAYELARKGREVELKPAQIHIHSFEVDTQNWPDLNFTLVCSKGTYVRSLAHDFGKALGSGAHLTRLRRTAIGHFSVGDALSVEAAIKAIEDKWIRHTKSELPS